MNENPLCPECNRPFQKGRSKCMWCGADLSGVDVPAMKFSCVDCGTEMEEAGDAAFSLHFCADCQGVWITATMMAILEKRYEEVKRDVLSAKGASPSPARISEEQYHANPLKYRKCPECRQMMARTRFRKISSVVVDECQGHGYWLDKDELGQVVQFMENGGLDAAKHYRPLTSSGAGHAASQSAAAMRLVMFMH